MLFYIDHSIYRVLHTRSVSNNEAVFFSNLANMYSRGECYLCGNVDSLDILSNKLGTPANSIYGVARGRYAENGTVMRTVRVMIILIYEEAFERDALPKIIRNSENVIFVPIPLAISWSLEKRCCIVAENLDDCAFYEAITAYYYSTHDLHGLRVSLHHENGGGNTTGKILEKCVTQDKTLTLCIVDSDKKWGSSLQYPNPPARGDTCRLVEKTSAELKKRNDIPPHHAYLLEVHEIENLIPRQIMRRIESEKLAEMKAGLDVLDALVANNRTDAILCYDYKNGLPYMKSAPQRAYWKEVLTTLGKTENDMPPCTKEEYIQQDGAKQSFPPILKHDLLHKAIDCLKDMDLLQLCLDDYLQDAWEQIGSLLFSWGCAIIPVYA